MGLVSFPRLSRAIKKLLALGRWEKTRKRLGAIGDNSFVGAGFSLVHPENIYIGNDFEADVNLILQTWPEYGGRSTGYKPVLSIGDGVHIAQECQISCMDRIEIGNGCLLGGNVFIADNLHGKSTRNELDTPPYLRPLYTKGPIKIGCNVWIGKNVCILPGVVIGNGAVIGANSVVTKDIPDYALAVGAPARIIVKSQ